MSVQALMNLATGYWQAAALSAAVDLGVFPCVVESSQSAEQIASRCQADLSYTTDLLDALAGLGLLAKQGGTYTLADEYEPYLNPGNPTCMLGALQYNAQLYPLWGRLADCVKSGSPAVPPQDHLGDNPQATRGFVMGMHSRAVGIAPMILSAIDIQPHAKLLDVGSGPGTFSRMLAEQHAGLAVAQFDLPGVIKVAQELTEPSAARDRISFSPGDYRNDPLPAGHDTLLYCGALHQETQAAAASLFAKFFEAMPSGGRLLVIDLMTEPGRTTPVFSALFSLNMKLFNPGARVYPTDQVESMLGEAGFTSVVTRPVDSIPYFCLQGKKP